MPRTVNYIHADVHFPIHEIVLHDTIPCNKALGKYVIQVTQFCLCFSVQLIACVSACRSYNIYSIAHFSGITLLLFHSLAPSVDVLSSSYYRMVLVYNEEAVESLTGNSDIIL